MEVALFHNIKVSRLEREKIDDQIIHVYSEFGLAQKPYMKSFVKRTCSTRLRTTEHEQTAILTPVNIRSKSGSSPCFTHLEHPLRCNKVKVKQEKEGRERTNRSVEKRGSPHPLPPSAHLSNILGSRERREGRARLKVFPSWNERKILEQCGLRLRESAGPLISPSQMNLLGKKAAVGSSATRASRV